MYTIIKNCDKKHEYRFRSRKNRIKLILADGIGKTYPWICRNPEKGDVVFYPN